VPEPRLLVALVVDDEPGVRELAAAALQMEGYLTLSACSAAEAAELARGRRERIDVLVTDVELGDGDGIDLAESIRANRPDIAILVISGDGTYQSRALGKRYAFLGKPFRATQLWDSVRGLVEA
jgi:DNA-binding NtrC family response regulator